MSIAADLPLYSDPHSPWERPTNENTNGLVRPGQVLGFLTPREAFEWLLADDLASNGLTLPRS